MVRVVKSKKFKNLTFESVRRDSPVEREEENQFNFPEYFMTIRKYFSNRHDRSEF